MARLDERAKKEPVTEPPPALPVGPIWRRRPSRWAIEVAALSAALLVLLAASALLFRSAMSADADTQRRAAVDAAQSVAVTLSTIGGANAASNLDDLAKKSTGEFHDQLAGYAPIFQRLLQSGNVASQGRVTAAGVERIDAQSAVVLVTVSTTLTNSQIPAGEMRNYRLAVQLTYSGTGWLASKVDYVG